MNPSESSPPVSGTAPVSLRPAATLSTPHFEATPPPIAPQSSIAPSAAPALPMDYGAVPTAHRHEYDEEYSPVRKKRLAVVAPPVWPERALKSSQLAFLGPLLSPIAHLLLVGVHLTLDSVTFALRLPPHCTLEAELDNGELLVRLIINPVATTAQDFLKGLTEGPTAKTFLSPTLEPRCAHRYMHFTLPIPPNTDLSAGLDTPTHRQIDGEHLWIVTTYRRRK